MKMISWTPKEKLTAFFLENPSKEFYETEVRKKTGISTGAVNNYLKELKSEGILLLNKRGAMNFYRLNRDDVRVKKLKVAYSMSLPLVKHIKNMGKKLGIKAYVYGSVARGEDTENSDWDLLVIGNVKLDALEKELKPIRSGFGGRIKVSVFTAVDWARMKKSDPAFYERVEKDKIELVWT